MPGTDRPDGRAGGVPPSAAPHRVRVPTNIHRWDAISFLHWPFAPADVERVVPDDLRVLTHDGMAWVTVTPFVMRVRPPGVPVVPPRWTFPETNVRTYVAGPDGREGLWFLHMEVTALWFVVALRTLGLPYVRRWMSVEVDAGQIAYRSRPGPSSGAGGHEILVRPGAELEPPEGGAWDRFVTARWAAFHRRGPVLLRTPVEHRAWRLRVAEVTTCSVDALFGRAGLVPPSVPPRAHFSSGVQVRVGVPTVVR